MLRQAETDTGCRQQAGDVLIPLRTTFGALGSIIAAVACMSCFSGAAPIVASVLGMSGLSIFAAVRGYNPWLLAFSGIVIASNVIVVQRRRHAGEPIGRVSGLAILLSTAMWLSSACYEVFTVVSDWK